MRKNTTIRIDEKTIEKLHDVKRETGIPISVLLEKSFLESGYNDEQNK